MSIQELIDYMESRKYVDYDYFGVSKHEQAAFEKANENIDECIRLVKDYQKENSRSDKRFEIIQRLLKELADDAPDDDLLEAIDRKDMIEMYADVQSLLLSMETVKENERNPTRQSLSRYDVLGLTRRVVVTDDWYPCVDENKVDLHLMLFCCPSGHQNYGDYYCVKLTAWGGDDTGVEIEKICWDLSSALKEYNRLFMIYNAIPDGVSRRWLCEKYDFRPA